MSIPFVFKPDIVDRPVRYGGPDNEAYNESYRGMWVDGGMLNNVPLHVFDYCLPQVLYRRLVREVIPVCWSLERARAEGLGTEQLEGKSISRQEHKGLSFVFKEPAPTDLGSLASKSSWPAISVYAGELLDALLYSANAGQYQNSERKAEVVEIDPAGIQTGDFSNITLDARRGNQRFGADKPDRSRTKMMAIMNAYNTTWDRLV